jgi:hypothetical protein
MEGLRYLGMVAPMSRKPDVTKATEDWLSLPPELLPPYELDPVVRKRVGKVIAEAVGQLVSKR